MFCSMLTLSMASLAIGALLMLRQYRTSGERLLLWTGISLGGFALTTIITIADVIAWRAADTAAISAIGGFVSASVAAVAVIWEHR
jgi:hypothetical protein